MTKADRRCVRDSDGFGSGVVARIEFETILFPVKVSR